MLRREELLRRVNLWLQSEERGEILYALQTGLVYDAHTPSLAILIYVSDLEHFCTTALLHSKILYLL